MKRPAGGQPGPGKVAAAERGVPFPGKRDDAESGGMILSGGLPRRAVGRLPAGGARGRSGPAQTAPPPPGRAKTATGFARLPTDPGSKEGRTVPCHQKWWWGGGAVVGCAGRNSPSSFALWPGPWGWPAGWPGLPASAGLCSPPGPGVNQAPGAVRKAAAEPTAAPGLTWPGKAAGIARQRSAY